MASESHSAQFGLEPQKGPTQNAGRGPGSGIEGTTGAKGHKNSTSATPGTAGATPGAAATQSDVGGVNQPGTDNERPGAGGSIVTPSQGSNKVGDEKTGLLDKLNPMKKS